VALWGVARWLVEAFVPLHTREVAGSIPATPIALAIGGNGPFPQLTLGTLWIHAAEAFLDHRLAFCMSGSMPRNCREEVLA
jgi:hypothetical protein